MINSIFYTKNGNSITVEPGDDLQVKYDELVADTSMGTLSATNWRTLLLSPGTYTITTKVTFDTDFIAIAAISSDKTATIVNGGIEHDCLLEQTCDTLALAGFTVLVESNYTSGIAMGGFWINGCDNVLSTYGNMNFDENLPLTATTGTTQIFPCVSVNNTAFKGLWIKCYSNWQSFRATGDVDGASDIEFSPTMIDCHAIISTNSGAPPPFLGYLTGGQKCFGGDGIGPLPVGTVSTVGATGLIIKGKYYNCTGGNQSFSGCTAFSAPIDSSAEFYNCHAGVNSFCLAEACAGYFENCSAEGNSFGGQGGTFSGEAVNCQVGDGLSLLSSIKGGFGSGTGGCSGTLRNCKIVEMNDALTVTGAYIDGLWAKTTETNGDAVILANTASKIYNSTLISNGTGESINVNGNTFVGAHNRMNVFSGAASNTVTTPYDVIDALIA